MKIIVEKELNIFSYPFFKSLKTAHEVHVKNFDEQSVQISDILSGKTGRCSEDCAYCAQSARNGTKIPKQPLMDPEVVLDATRRAKVRGASRFCMSASGRSMSSKIEFKKMCEMVKSVKALGLKTFVTLGFFTEDQAVKLKKPD